MLRRIGMSFMVGVIGLSLISGCSIARTDLDRCVAGTDQVTQEMAHIMKMNDKQLGSASYANVAVVSRLDQGLYLAGEEQRECAATATFITGGTSQKIEVRYVVTPSSVFGDTVNVVRWGGPKDLPYNEGGHG